MKTSLIASSIGICKCGFAPVNFFYLAHIATNSYYAHLVWKPFLAASVAFSLIAACDVVISPVRLCLCYRWVCADSVQLDFSWAEFNGSFPNCGHGLIDEGPCSGFFCATLKISSNILLQIVKIWPILIYGLNISPSLVGFSNRKIGPLSGYFTVIPEHLWSSLRGDILKECFFW